MECKRGQRNKTEKNYDKNYEKQEKTQKRKTPCSAQAAPAYTRKATPTRKIQTCTLYCKTLIYRPISRFTSRKLSHTTNAQRHQIRLGNLHPSLPCKHWLLWAEIQLCSCSFFCKDVLFFLIVEKCVPGGNVIFFFGGECCPQRQCPRRPRRPKNLKNVGEKFPTKNRPTTDVWNHFLTSGGWGVILALPWPRVPQSSGPRFPGSQRRMTIWFSSCTNLNQKSTKKRTEPAGKFPKTFQLKKWTWSSFGIRCSPPRKAFLWSYIIIINLSNKCSWK